MITMAHPNKQKPSADPAVSSGEADHRLMAEVAQGSVEAFSLDRAEATIGDCLRVAVNHLVPVRDADMPTNLAMTNITFDQAVEYAERMGKRLPTQFEYEYAATMGARGGSRGVTTSQDSVR